MWSDLIKFYQTWCASVYIVNMIRFDQIWSNLMHTSAHHKCDQIWSKLMYNSVYHQIQWCTLLHIKCGQILLSALLYIKFYNAYCCASNFAMWTVVHQILWCALLCIKFSMHTAAHQICTLLCSKFYYVHYYTLLFYYTILVHPFP